MSRTPNFYIRTRNVYSRYTCYNLEAVRGVWTNQDFNGGLHYVARRGVLQLRLKIYYSVLLPLNFFVTCVLTN